jgi:hypothetical protein
MRRALLTLTAALTAGAAFSAETKLTQPPRATRANARVVIAFAVSSKTDVEVAILGAGGKVVRTISDSPYMLATVRGMVTDKNGKYIKTVMPFAANLPREKVGAFSYGDEKKQRFIMKNYSDVYPYYLPLAWKNSKLVLGSTNANNGIFLSNGRYLYRFGQEVLAESYPCLS